MPSGSNMVRPPPLTLRSLSARLTVPRGPSPERPQPSPVSPGPLQLPANVPAGLKAGDWHTVDTLCAHVASFLHHPADATALEAALDRPVDGLWAAFGGRRLRKILAPEIERQRRQLGHRRAMALHLPPDAEMRRLCSEGLRLNDLAGMDARRVRELHARLASESWKELPLLQQVERERYWRQDNDFGRLRRQWHDYLLACQPRAAAHVLLPQGQARTTVPAVRKVEHAATWAECFAWLTQSQAAQQLRSEAEQFLAALGDTHPGADTPQRRAAMVAMLQRCLDALDVMAQEEGLRCPLTPCPRGR